MYLEISGRQTGKTSRLINQIQFDKDNYDVQILMGINNNSLKVIKQKIKHNNKVKVCLSFDSLRLIIANNPHKIIRLYVDEFLYSTAFCNNFEQIEQKYKKLIIDGYFSSSINSNNNNILYQLQLQNNKQILTANYTSNFLI